PGHLVRILAADLARLSQEFVLALDDYHVIRHPEAEAIVNGLLRMGSGPLHLVISTRELPRLSMSRLRANQQLTEIDFGHLRFTPEEAEAFFARCMDGVLSAEEVATIHRQMDGWAAGLRLAAIATIEGGGALSGPAAHQLTRNAQDYLYEEVVLRQTD